nr:cobalt transporter [uncultured Blautia sp.]
MHLIKDENGNVIPHGGEGHHHDHDHAHEHCQACGEGCEKNCTDEVVALLNYMLSHNQHHAEELDQMAENLTKLGMEDAARTIKEGVADFQKGNMRLGLALTLVKEHLK